MITGVQLLCDNCLPMGVQVSDRFHISTDEEGAPVIKVVCPTCKELLEHVFVGVSADQRLRKGGGATKAQVIQWLYDHELNSLATALNERHFKDED